MKRLSWPILVILLILSIGATIYVNESQRRSRKALQAKADRLREYCTVVHVALGDDVADFESADPVRRARAAARFGEVGPYHSTQEILLCSTVEPDLSMLDVCVLGRDYACLARLARTAVETTKGSR